LDLFAGAGGAAKGYADAGFEVVGVDKYAQPRYPFEFHQADVFDLSILWMRRFDVIHASPPCQHYAAVTRWRGSRDDHENLVPPTRALLYVVGRPWIMENVREAELHDPIMLCGSMFGLRVKRHRYFESNIPLPLLAPASCSHHRLLPFEHKGERAYADAMGCEWMTSKGAREAIPPAYTEFLGQQLLDHITTKASQ
jgi:DNA (cytosine-5)-methyltransferase 1